MILVTGSAGRIGQAVVKELLARGHQMRGYDLRPTPHLPDCIEGNLLEAEKLSRAFAGVNTLIHLAATPDDADFAGDLVPNNILGLHHVLESARHAGVQRIILASSGQMNHWQRERREHPINTEDPITPFSWYAATKAFAEAIGRGFAERHGISVLIARLGWVPRSREHWEECRHEFWARDVYLSPGDVGRFYTAMVEAPKNIRFQIFYATSKPSESAIYDLDSAKELLGWEPQDQFPAGLDFE